MAASGQSLPHFTPWYAAEMFAASEFAKRGYVISWPTVPTKYDLIVDNGTKLFKIQVKQGYIRPQRRKPAGKGDLPAYRIGLWRKNRNDFEHKPFKVTEFDYLAAVCDGNIYVIPVSLISSAEVPGCTVRMILIKPPSETTRADSLAAIKKWEACRNNFVLT